MKGVVPRVSPWLIQENREANPESGDVLYTTNPEHVIIGILLQFVRTPLSSNSIATFTQGSHTRSRFPENAQQAGELAQLRHGLKKPGLTADRHSLIHA